jgi:hypothetical protein
MEGFLLLILGGDDFYFVGVREIWVGDGDCFCVLIMFAWFEGQKWPIIFYY